jgi:ABC-type nitrate/sulfonate/bicarbonate transport system ATPase subunit
MDEPSAALDGQNRAKTEAEMGRLLAEADASARKTTARVTHRTKEAILLSGRIVVQSSRPRLKRIVELDPPRPGNEDLQESTALRRQLRELIDCESKPRWSLEMQPLPDADRPASRWIRRSRSVC